MTQSIRQNEGNKKPFPFPDAPPSPLMLPSQLLLSYQFTPPPLTLYSEEASVAVQRAAGITDGHGLPTGMTAEEGQEASYTIPDDAVSADKGSSDLSLTSNRRGRTDSTSSTRRSASCSMAGLHWHPCAWSRNMCWISGRGLGPGHFDSVGFLVQYQHRPPDCRTNSSLKPSKTLPPTS